MPLHLQSITNIEVIDLLENIMEEMQKAEYLHRIGKYMLTSKDVFDLKSKN